MKSRAAIALACFACASAFAATRPGPGDAAPRSLGLARNGDAVEVERSTGKVQVVTFWASWCGPCKKELPILEGLQRAAKDRVRVVAVNIEDRAQFRKVAQVLESLTLTLTHDYGKAASEAYGVNGIPHLVIIGRDGRIVAVHRGYSEESIDSILGEINAELAKQ